MSHEDTLSVPDDSSALVAAARRGDGRAFAALHGRYARMVHAVLLARVKPEDADDLVQDVFLVMLRKLGTLEDQNAVGAWLCRIARNLAVDHHRGQRAKDELPEDLSAPDRPIAECREVLAMVQALPEAYRETLVMRLVEGMSGPEIAEQTGLTPGSVRVNLHRGMLLLRQRLGIEEEP